MVEAEAVDGVSGEWQATVDWLSIQGLNFESRQASMGESREVTGTPLGDSKCMLCVQAINKERDFRNK